MIRGRFAVWVPLTVAVLVISSPGRTRGEESNAAEAAAADPSAAAAVGDPVVSDAPEAEPPATAQPTSEESAAETPATEAPAAEEPTAEEPAAEEPAAAEPPATRSRVRLKLDVEGEIFATVGADAPPLRLPTKLEARFDFIEAAGDPAAGCSVERRYRDAVAEVRVDGGLRRIALAADARVVRFAVLGTTPAPFLPEGHLTREELDLLETPFDPLLTAAILPRANVAVNEPWEIPADATAGLLAIDTVESGRIEARVTDVVEGVATVAVEGIVDGAVDGVPTHLTVEGTCSLPATAAGESLSLEQPPRVVNVTIRERREAGHVAPGFEVEARVWFSRDPLAAEEGDVAAEGGESVRSGGQGRPGLVWHRDAMGRYEILHDSRWKMIEDGLDGLVMRLVDRGALVAQCSVTALPRGPAADPPTIADLERDLQKSLAGQMTGVEHSSEASRSDGVRIVRVVATGKAGDLPFRWVHAVLTDASGHRVAVTCMLEAALRDRFGTADRDLVDGIRLPSGAGASRDETGEPIDREARLPPSTPTP